MSLDQHTEKKEEIKQNYYEIVSDIPVNFHTTTNRYAILASKMKAGDSVLVQTDTERKSLMTAISRLGGQGKSRQTNQGLRVWRVA